MLNGIKSIMILKEYKKAFNLINRFYKRSLLFIVIASLFLIIFDTLSIVAIFPVVALLFGNDDPILNDKFFFPNEIDLNIYIALIILLSLFLFKFLLTIISNYLISNFKMNLQKNISKSILREYLKRDYLDFLKIKYSDAIRVVTKETEIFVNSAEALIRIVVESTVLVILFLVLINTNPILTLYSFGFLLIFGILFDLMTKAKMEKWGRQRLLHDGLRVKNLIQTMELISEIKLQKREEQFVKLFNQDNAITQRTQRNRLLISYFLRSLLEFCVIIVFVGSLGIMLILDLNIINFLPTLTLFIVILLRFLPGVLRIIQSLQLLKFSKVSFLELDLILKNHRGNQILFQPKNVKKLFLPKNKIELDNLSFNYNSNSKEVLSNVNLTFGTGDIIGLSGESGAGKSTLISIIMGLIKPTKGNIFINNFRIDDDPTGYQNSIGYVSQNFSIVDSTVIQNITMNFDNKKFDERKLDLALEITNSKKFINQLDDGIFSNLGQSSYVLSGGQKQRIAIARAIYHFNEILILDEATTSMDNKLESEVMNKIKGLVKDKICLVVSHNKVSFDICNRILRVKNGKIIEDLSL